jgi:hypothetical protein
VIPKQAVRKQICDRLEILFEQSHEQIIVSFFQENILAVHAAVIDVVVGVVE